MKTTLTFISIIIIGTIISCEKSSEPTSEPTPPSGTITIRVPADAPTIEAALDSAASGDTILVADGVYSGDGNRDIVFPCKQVILMSENGPLSTIIDCEGANTSQHFGFMFINCDSTPVIDGFTIRNAYFNLGAAIACQNFEPQIKNCILVDNHATVSGGAIRCKSASPRFSNCTIVRNSSDMVGAGLFLIAGAQPVLDGCVISHSTVGEAIYSSDNTSIPVLTCCTIYGNSGGDWTDKIIDQFDGVTNYDSDPSYCDMAQDDFRVQVQSICNPENNQCQLPIGAAPTGCD